MQNFYLQFSQVDSSIPFYKNVSADIFGSLCNHDQCNREVWSMKMSSLQGIVRPPIGWLYPNSSSAWLSNSWNVGSFSNEIGTTNLFFSPSPTYTAKYPFGTSMGVERRRICLALERLGNLIAMLWLNLWVERKLLALVP